MGARRTAIGGPALLSGIANLDSAPAARHGLLAPRSSRNQSAHPFEADWVRCRRLRNQHWYRLAPSPFIPPARTRSWSRDLTRDNRRARTAKGTQRRISPEQVGFGSTTHPRQAGSKMPVRTPTFTHLPRSLRCVVRRRRLAIQRGTHAASELPAAPILPPLPYMRYQGLRIGRPPCSARSGRDRAGCRYCRAWLLSFSFRAPVARHGSGVV